MPPSSIIAPATLIARRQWVLWRAEGAKGSKVPYTIGGVRRASSTDPRTWASFDDVLRCFERDPERYSGIGYVLSGDDGLVGVDLDDCRDPETGAIAPWARAILDSLHTYSEVSPSGCGVKAWARGALAESVKTAHVEVYPRARYFAVTGQRLEEYPAEPQDAQAALDALAEHYGRGRGGEAPAYATPPPTADSHHARWARRVLGAAVAKTIAAMDGEKHNELLGAARLAAGAMPHISEQEIEQTLYDAIRLRAADPRGALKTIRDGIKMGVAKPLEPPTPPTSEGLAVKDGRAYCPRCGGEVRKSKYPYPGTEEPGWYCPDCKGAMKWPAEAFTPATPRAARPEQPAPPAAPVEYAEAPPIPTPARSLAVEPIEPTRYYIDGMLRAGLALFIGNPGIGKTPAAVQLSLAFAAGGMWLGALPCRKSRVLYIGVEYDKAYVKEVMLDSTGTAAVPSDLYIHTVETFTPPSTEEQSINMLEYYLRVMEINVLNIDVFSGFLPREKFKQDKYRGDYAEFLAYHRLCMHHKALLVGMWHGNKRDKDPETAYNGGQGLWGSAGGGRLTMFYDDDQQVRLRSQLRGHERKEYVLEQARVSGAHFWSVVDADPDPIFASEAQRAIYQTIKKYSSSAEPLAPNGVRGILKSERPELELRDVYVRQFIGRLEERGILRKIGGGYVIHRGSPGSPGSGGSPGSPGSPEIVHPLHSENAQEAIQPGSVLRGSWIAPIGYGDAENEGAIQAIHDFSRSTELQSDPDDRPVDDPDEEL